MAKRATGTAGAAGVVGPAGKPSALLDTRVIYCGDNLEQLAKLPHGCIDLIYSVQRCLRLLDPSDRA